MAGSEDILEPFQLDPPLLNSANPWATTKEDLQRLFRCPYTGAVTIRTSLLEGFRHDATIHQYAFFSAAAGCATGKANPEGPGDVKPVETSSLNTLGYSPYPLSAYLNMLVALWGDRDCPPQIARKPVIVSVTGSAKEVAECYARVAGYHAIASSGGMRLMMEINLSCPNILNKPPPAYDGGSLREYITAIHKARMVIGSEHKPIHVGIKTPPYTHQGQFDTLIRALEDTVQTGGISPISFITATNTLGSCLVLDSDNQAALGSASGLGIGGMAGDALHPLALGNVKTIRGMLDSSKVSGLRRIAIIGVGGVSDAAGYKRMRSAGAAAVAVGTALGREGLSVLAKIHDGLTEADLAPK